MKLHLLALLVFIAAAFTAILVDRAWPHDIYTGLYNWDGQLCCNGNDCQKAADPQIFKPIAEGMLVKPTGEVVKHGQLGISPDGYWHICRWPANVGAVRCILIPNGGM